MSEKVSLPVSAGEGGCVVEEGHCGLEGASGRRVESPVREEGPGESYS